MLERLGRFLVNRDAPRSFKTASGKALEKAACQSVLKNDQVRRTMGVATPQPVVWWRHLGQVAGTISVWVARIVPGISQGGHRLDESSIRTTPGGNS
jgi:hypothetical protein